MDQLSLEMRSEYIVGYHAGRAQNDGRYHKVRVAVQPPAGMARVRTSWRHGYFAPENSGWYNPTATFIHWSDLGSRLPAADRTSRERCPFPRARVKMW